MRFRLSILVTIVVLGFLGIRGLSRTPNSVPPRFEAHEFAIFRSQYEAIRLQPAEKRLAHFRGLRDALQTAQLTVGMTETLAEFCHEVARTEVEPAVQAEIRLALLVLDAKLVARAPAAVEARK